MAEQSMFTGRRENKGLPDLQQLNWRLTIRVSTEPRVAQEYRGEISYLPSIVFVRPIQVGDAIEINGTWATVTRINVRSTIVQTYDNASLIIPNSDLISQQVSNWSFKDFRLRRAISVGVAYGSDIELVRNTLLEIADKTPKVLKYPQPDVIFSDFGDSALIFILRI